MNEITTKNPHRFIVILGILMHIIFLWGVLDSNFHSPIISGLKSVPIPEGAPAKRILIFLADGLRYRTFKEEEPPFLSNILKSKGSGGICHVRLPTESRPGNVAVVAGLYEDPSALFKGWKKNPVNFDSVFNQSYTSWIWGSPDITSLFTETGNDQVNIESYPAEWQDFDSTKSGSTQKLDSWVFKKYQDWLSVSADNYKVTNKLVFYFHLLGCDTAGHSSKPQSKEYIENIMYVDKEISNIVNKTEHYFEKNSTAYIFVSDHGMTDWGSHGSGSTDEIETPFVAWGAGLSKNSKFQIIEQADLTPLISTLVGINIPVNNEGVLPYEILDLNNDKYVAKAFLCNLEQINEQIKAIRKSIIGKGLANMCETDIKFNEKLNLVKSLINEKYYKDSLIESKEAAKLAKDSLIYYRRYQTNRFIICLLVMWICWIVLIFLNVSSKPKISFTFNSFIVKIIILVLIVPLTMEFAITGFTAWRLFGYGIIAIFSLFLVLKGIIHKKPQLQLKSENLIAEITGLIALMIIMYFGLTYRWLLSIGMFLNIYIQKKLFKNLRTFFLITGFLLAFFPLLPVVGPQSNLSFVLFSEIFVIILVLASLNMKKRKMYIICIELIRLTFTLLKSYGLLYGYFLVSWIILFTTPFIIWLYPVEWKQRIFGISITFFCPLALLSVSYEPLFYLIFSLHILNWPVQKTCDRNSKNDILSIRNLSTATFLMFYSILCFFGTGNIASLSSFDPQWTRHFVTIFSPFTMTALILLKIIIPMLLVGCLIRTLATNSQIFLAVLILGDCLAIPLMLNVTSYGSWLDIGSKISRFVIAIVLPFIFLILHNLTKPLLTFSIQKNIFSSYSKKHVV